MKPKFIYTVLIAGMLGLSSCDDVLDKKNLSAVTSEATWNDKTLATAFLDYCYKVNLPDWESDVVSANGYSDDDRSGDDFFYADQLTTEGGGGPTAEYWPYSGIYTLNELLDNINTGSLSANDKATIEAQALFLRSYRYFELVKRYGGVPLILSVQSRENAEVPRAKTSECIKQIVDDLDKAASVLPGKWSSNDAGRITRGAALALKGSCHIWIDGEGEGGMSDAFVFKIWEQSTAPVKPNPSDIYYLCCDCPGMSPQARTGQMWYGETSVGDDLKEKTVWKEYKGDVEL